MAFRSLDARLFDGTKSIPLDALPEDAWHILTGHTAGEESTAGLFKAVPWLFRGVTLRAQTLADIPWAVMRGETEVITSEETGNPPKGFEWTATLNRLLYTTELDLCLTGSAYWFREANRLRTLGYRRMLPRTIRPQYNDTAGLVGFERQLANGQVLRLKPEDVIYWWLPSVDAEVGPGTPPAAVALAAAGVIRNVDEFAKSFFSRGAVNMLLLSVEGNPPPKELDRLQVWWRRLVGGVKKAWETVAVSAKVTPQIISNPPRELAMPELTKDKREDVATALGIPHSILFSNAANFATARQDYMSFFTLCLLPEAELIETAINEQIFTPLGLEFRFQPRKLEVFQAYESEKAYALVAPWQVGLLKRSEFREQMGLEVDDATDDVYIYDTPASTATPQRGSDAQSRADASGQRAGAAAVSQRKAWERKALKAIKDGRSANVLFDTDALPGWEQDAIRDALTLAASAEEVKAAFTAAPFRGYP